MDRHGLKAKQQATSDHDQKPLLWVEAYRACLRARISYDEGKWELVKVVHTPLGNVNHYRIK